MRISQCSSDRVGLKCLIFCFGLFRFGINIQAINFTTTEFKLMDEYSHRVRCLISLEVI